MTTNIKTVFNHPTKGQDIRRFQLGSLEKPFDQLLGFLTDVYQLSPEKLTIRYRDDDGDDCSIGSNLELSEAFRIVHQEGRSVLKVEISLDEDAPRRSSDPTLERTPSGSDEEFVKVEIESETKEPDRKMEQEMDTKIPETKAVDNLKTTDDNLQVVPNVKEQVIPNENMKEQVVPNEIVKEQVVPNVTDTHPTGADVECKVNDDVPNGVVATKETQSTKEVVSKPVEPEDGKMQEAEPQLPPQKDHSEIHIEEKQREALEFPSRTEFFSLLAEFLHDSKVMESAQLLLPGLLKLLDDTNRPSAIEILKNIFDFAPSIKEAPLSQRLIPFTDQLASDQKLLPFVKDALRKLHDGSKLASFFRSGPKGSIPYMPDFVRLYNYMSTLVTRPVTDEKEKIPQSPSSYSPVVVHRGIQCDGCSMLPIQGNRYKCYICRDYDLCEMCEEANKHPLDHPMLKIRFPIQNRSGRQNHKPEHPKAAFIEDVTLRDGISCYPGISVLKTWALKNTGEYRWPPGVQLVFLSGDLVPERLLEVPRPEPGMVVRVSAAITLPSTPKQYTGYYRLATAEGKKFGPRIWVDVIVVPGTEVPQVKEVKEETKVEQRDSDEIPIQILPSPSPSVENKQESNKIQEQEQPKVATEEPKIDVPKPEPTLDKKTEEPKIEPKVDNKSLEEPKREEPKLEEPKVEGKKENLTLPQKPKAQSPYEHQLEILDGMGFQDRELNSYLLANNEGNVQRVVEWILTHMVNN